ncbi:MAG: hypothetical protein E7053_04530 [Lentisphaerae bacterium]|nr:hypothetical protein [Lentisphaerota bacterium]
MKKAVLLKGLFLLVMAAICLLATGCNSYGQDNNYLRPVDFVNHLNRNGIRVDAVRPLDPRPLSASDALELRIGESNIGVYKYDISRADQRTRLERIKQNKRVYFIGIPYPIYEVSGSFIVVGLDKHKDKERILEALRTFK